jgi:uncharacterized protein (UPF0262 family)
LPRTLRICESVAAMADYRIAKITLDEDTILWHGPYDLKLAVHEGRLVLTIATQSGEPLETLILGLARFRRPIRDYFAICDSYYQAIRKATAAEIETIDMARRAIHNDAANLLLERLEGKVETDHLTARRLFTLICVLHIRG